MFSVLLHKIRYSTWSLLHAKDTAQCVFIKYFIDFFYFIAFVVRFICFLLLNSLTRLFVCPSCLDGCILNRLMCIVDSDITNWKKLLTMNTCLSFSCFNGWSCLLDKYEFLQWMSNVTKGRYWCIWNAGYLLFLRFLYLLCIHFIFISS